MNDQEELPNIDAKDAVCYIDFEFQCRYHEPLNSKKLLQDCIQSAVNEVLSTIQNGQVAQLGDDDIDIPEIEMKTKESNVGHSKIKVRGYITCKDRQRQVYEQALQLAQQSRKISKQIVERTNIKKTQMQIQQFSTKYSNAHHVNKSFIDGTEKDFKEFQKRANSRKEVEDEKNNQQQQQPPPPIQQDNNDNNNGNDEEPEEEPPLTSLNPGSMSVVVNPNIQNDESVHVYDNQQNNENQNINNETDNNVDDAIDNNNNNNNNDNTANNEIGANLDDEEYVDVVDGLSKQSTNDNDESFEKIDIHGDDQSSNDDVKSSKQQGLHLDVDPVEYDAQSGDDFTNITPRMPHVSPIISPKPDSKQAEEINRLQLEILRLNQKHSEDLQHFQNKMNKIKREKEVNLKKQKSRMSMQIDEELLHKDELTKNEDLIYKLQSQLRAAQNEESVTLKQIQLQHQTELQKFDFKLRQTQQLHSLELNNIKSQHQFEKDQLQEQVRALTGSLERESKKDRKIHELTEENEQLKADKERMKQNYETVIDRLNSESEENIQNEIDRRVKETAQLRREINELKQQMMRDNKRKEQLEVEVKQLKDQNEDKDRFIAQLQNMYQKEKAKASQLHRKVMKSKRNVITKDDKQSQKEQNIIDKGGHVRKPSKGLQGRTVTRYNLDTGNTVIEIEKNKPLDMNQINEQLGIAGDDDLELDTDSEFDDDDEDKKMMAEDEHIAEIELKDKEIAALKEKVSNFESNIEALKTSTTEELQASQQKIGSLQQQLEQAQENFMKQNQMLQFKLQQKETYSKNLDVQLKDLKLEHKREIRALNYEMDNYKQDILDKDTEIQSLQENIEMLEQENASLKEYEQDLEVYEEEMNELDEHYQQMLEEIRLQNEQTQQQLELLEKEKESETADLKKTVHRHRSTIAELNELVQSMKEAENAMQTREAELKQVMKSQSQKNLEIKNRRRDSRELPDSDINDINNNSVSPRNEQQQQQQQQNNNNSNTPPRRQSYPIGPVLDQDPNDNLPDDDPITDRGLGQEDQPQPIYEPDTPSFGMATSNISDIDMSIYIKRDEVDEIINDRLAKQQKELEQKLKYDHALSMDSVQDTYKQKLQRMQEQHKTDRDRLEKDNQIINGQLQETKNLLQDTQKNMREQIDAAEKSRIRLLESFMKEMDRMREEIKKLNQLRNGRNQTGRNQNRR